MMALNLALTVLCAASPRPAEGIPSGIVLLRVARDPEGIRAERRLFDELGLAMDEFMVLAQEPPVPLFDELPLPRQLELVQGLAQAEGAVAVTWLSAPGPHEQILHLVAVRTGRTMVRSVAAGRTTRAEASLALAAREMLGTAYLFEPERVRQQAGVSAIVQELREQLAPAPAPHLPWAITVGTSYLHGLGTGPRSPAQLEGLVGLGRRAWRGLDLTLELGGRSGPGVQDEQRRIDSWEAEAAFRGDWVWAIGAWRTGPTAALALSYRAYRTQSDGQPDGLHESLKLQGRIGAFVSRRCTEHVELWLRAQLGLASHQDRFERVSDGTLILATPWRQASLTLGARFELMRGLITSREGS